MITIKIRRMSFNSRTLIQTSVIAIVAVSMLLLVVVPGIRDSVEDEVKTRRLPMGT